MSSALVWFPPNVSAHELPAGNTVDSRSEATSLTVHRLVSSMRLLDGLWVPTICNHYGSASTIRSIAARGATRTVDGQLRPSLRYQVAGMTGVHGLGRMSLSAPPCLRQRRLPRIAGARHNPPARVLAPQRQLASIGSILRA